MSAQIDLEKEFRALSYRMSKMEERVCSQKESINNAYLIIQTLMEKINDKTTTRPTNCS